MNMNATARLRTVNTRFAAVILVSKLSLMKFHRCPQLEIQPQRVSRDACRRKFPPTHLVHCLFCLPKSCVGYTAGCPLAFDLHSCRAEPLLLVDTTHSDDSAMACACYTMRVPTVQQPCEAAALSGACCSAYRSSQTSPACKMAITTCTRAAAVCTLAAYLLKRQQPILQLCVLFGAFARRPLQRWTQSAHLSVHVEAQTPPARSTCVRSRHGLELCEKSSVAGGMANPRVVESLVP